MQRPSVVVLAWLVTVLACAWLALFRASVVSDVSQFLPRNGAGAELLDDFYASAAARLILIGLQGDTVEARAETSRRLAEALRLTGLFVRVANGSEQLGADEQRALFTHRYLFSSQLDAEKFTAEGLRTALQERLRELQSPASVLGKRLLPEDPTGELLPLLRFWLGGYRQPDSRLGVWFSQKGERALLLVETRTSGLDPQAQAPVVQAIEDAFTAARSNTAVTLLLAGPGVIASASEKIIRDEATWLSIGSSVFVLVLLIVSYRSPLIVLLSLLAPVSAVLVAMAVVRLLFGGIHGITLGFGCTLMGIAVDYPIHLLSRMHGGETAMATLRRIWSTLLLCVVTTAIGYLPMLSGDFPSLTQLAVFSISGLATTVMFTRYVLPQLLPPAWHPPDIGRAWMMPLLRRLGSAGRIVACIIVLLASAAVLTFVAPPRWENDIAALSSIPHSVLAHDELLRADLKAPEPGQMIVIRAPDAELALQKSEALAARLRALVEEGGLSGFEAPSFYLPSLETQRTRQAILPSRDKLEAELGRAQAGLPFKPDLFAPFLDAVEKARTGPLATPDNLAQTPLRLRLGVLLFPRREGWTAIVPLSGVADPTRLADFAASFGDAAIRYVDLRAETNRLIIEFRNGALLKLAGGAVLLFVVLWAGLKSWRRTLAVLLPVPLAILADLAIVSLLGQRISLFHLVSVLLVIGTTSDYSLFFNRTDLDAADRKRNLQALLLCWSTTVAGFGLLSLSSIPVLQAIGTTLTAGLTAGLLLAALLTQPDLRPLSVRPKN